MKAHAILFLLIMFVSLLNAQIGLNYFTYSPNQPMTGDTLRLISSYNIIDANYNVTFKCGTINNVTDTIVQNNLYINLFFEYCYHNNAPICNRLDTFEFVINHNNISNANIEWYMRNSMCFVQRPYIKTDSAIINFSSTGMRDEDIIKHFSALPNPVTDQLIITSAYGSQPEQIWLYDIHGKLIKKELNTTQNLNMQDLARGIYFLQIKFKDGVERLKIVKD